MQDNRTLDQAQKKRTKKHTGDPDLKVHVLFVIYRRVFYNEKLLIRGKLYILHVRTRESKLGWTP